MDAAANWELIVSPVIEPIHGGKILLRLENLKVLSSLLCWHSVYRQSDSFEMHDSTYCIALFLNREIFKLKFLRWILCWNFKESTVKLSG